MKRQFFTIAIALAMAILAGLGVVWYEQAAQARAVEQLDPATLLIASDSIPIGMSLSEAQASGLIGTDTVPARLLPEAALTSVTSTNGALVALGSIPKGQVLLEDAFGTAITAPTALNVPGDFVAVSLQLEPPDRVGAFLRPGSRVAVYATTPIPVDQSGNSTLQTGALIGDVQVIAVGPTTAQQATSADAAQWDQAIVTLAVKPADAKRLLQAATTGKVHLVMLGDEVVPGTSRAGSPAGSTGTVSDATLFAPTS